MKVLVACEESQEVCKAFRELGHEAFSCDILPCSGGHPEWHIHDDVLKHLDDGWDIIIAFPPCQYLTNAGMCNLTRKHATDEYRKNRLLKRDKAKDFVLKIYNSNCNKVVIENPIGYLSTGWKKPSQIIKPYEFGHSINKRTCLWLKGLNELKPTKIVKKGEITVWDCNNKKISKWYKDTLKEAKGDMKLLTKIRSKTFTGIAKAMAEQWGGLLNKDSANIGEKIQ